MLPMVLLFLAPLFVDIIKILYNLNGIYLQYPYVPLADFHTYFHSCMMTSANASQKLQILVYAQCMHTHSITQPLCNEESALLVIVSSDLKNVSIHSCTAFKLKHKVVLDNEELHITWVISIFQQQIYCLRCKVYLN